MDENFNMSDFINFDQQEYHDSPSPADTFKAEPSSSQFDSQSMFYQQSNQQNQYNGPSHDYGQFKQQTGLPTGAMSHVKAVNDFSSQVHPTGFAPNHMANYNTGLDMDFDASASGSAVPGFSYPADGTEEFIDPSAVASSTQAQPMNRAWPGMHSQQAQQAQQSKADAAAREQVRRQEQVMNQQPLPKNFEQTFQNQSGRSSSHSSSDAHAREQISKLLNTMRNNSSASSHEEDLSQPISDLPHIQKARKDEEEMDEDERLLASEEGKKLSSKERRQLRNKVSARAFRSRRKEYIGQLEGEVAAKANECNELKSQNSRLMEQNSQLTQLTKAMLAHPAFNSFMNDMSNDTSFMDGLNSNQQSSSSQRENRPSTQKQDSRNGDVTHVGMSMIPDSNLNLSTLNLGGNNQWAPNSNGFPFHRPQVFAVFDVTQGPLPEEMRPSRLSEKTRDMDAPDRLESLAKLDAPAPTRPKGIPLEPVIPPTTAPSSTSKPRDESDICDDPSFALYVDNTTTATSMPLPSLSEALDQLEDSLTSKPSSFFSLRTISRQENDAALRRVDRMFATVEAASRRIEVLTRHLPS